MNPVVPTPQGEKWAVIQTASIMQDSDIILFRDSAGNRAPVVLFSHEDELKARKAKRRIQVAATRVNGFDGVGMVTSSPVLGVIKIKVDLPKPRLPQKVVAAVPPANGAAQQAHKAKETAGKK